MTYLAYVRQLQLHVAVVIVFIILSSTAKVSDHPIVIVVSFDGFRYDYLKKLNDTVGAPNFKYLIDHGVQAEWIQPSFPSLTFPNHHTIATGLYPESHGITANSFYDPILNDVFTMKSEESEWWDTGVTPLYILNEMAAQGRYSGVMMWVGSFASYHNRTATHVQLFDEEVPFEKRVDGVIRWLVDEHKPANVIFLYFEQPDSSGHWYGPEAEEVVEQIRRADNVTGYLINELKRVDLFDRAHLIITSDHGMAAVPMENEINLMNAVNKSLYDDYNDTPITHIHPKPGLNNEVYEAFKKASVGSHFSVYWKEEIPEAYHYRNNLRISPIVLLANVHYQINTSPNVHLLGNHGFNNTLTDMRAFLIAHGPSFKKNHTSPSFKNVDIYPLVSHLLGIVPASNNGTFEDIKDLLRDPNDDAASGSKALLVVLAVIVVCIVAAALFVLLRFSYRRLSRRDQDEETRPVVYFGSLP